MKLAFEQVFMFYLPRICEHCLNPSCVASCPSGAMYKREEDGIVLVDQDRCRGWRFCVSGCPYKKVYFNHRTGKAEKCTLLLPADRGRPADDLLGDLRRPAALPRPRSSTTPTRCSTPPRHPDRRDLYHAQLSVFLDPHDPQVQAAGQPRQGIPARLARRRARSPVYALASGTGWRCPLHPEYRTLPMVWYIPPLSPVADIVHAAGYDAATTGPGVRRHRGAAHSRRVPGQPVHRRGPRPGPARCCARSPPSAP